MVKRNLQDCETELWNHRKRAITAAIAAKHFIEKAEGTEVTDKENASWAACEIQDAITDLISFTNDVVYGFIEYRNRIERPEFFNKEATAETV